MKPLLRKRDSDCWSCDDGEITVFGESPLQAWTELQAARRSRQEWYRSYAPRPSLFAVFMSWLSRKSS